MGRSNTTKRGPLPDPDVQFSETTLTAHAGAVPLIRFLNDRLELPALLAVAVPSSGRERRYPVHLVLYAFLVGALLGAVKLAHLEWLRGDAVVQKFVRLAAWPVRKVFSEALASVSDGALAALYRLLTGFGLRSITGATSAVLDFDSTALRCFGTQEGAVFGYCGKGRNRRRHHPIVASVAASRAVIHAKYRDGSGIGEQEAMAFIGEAVTRVRGAIPTGPVSVRADSGFWSNATGAWLLEKGIPFAIVHPLRAGLKIMLATVTFTPVETREPGDDDPDGADGDIETGVLGGEALGYDPRLRIVIIRRRVVDPKAPPPGKVVEWSPDWRYQAIITSLDWEPLDVWRFYNDRADAERIFKVGKHALGLGWFVGQLLRANEVAFLLRLLAWNCDLLFQQDAELRARRAERPVRRMGLQARQHYIYRLPGRLLRVHDRWVLRLSASEKLASLWSYFSQTAPSSA